MSPQFSVILPTYNRAQHLGAALESIITQSFKSYEIIVVDDGSTDNTDELLARYSTRIRILRQDRNGPGAARNLGIEHANGRYITFLDSDDLWFPWTLASYAQVIREVGKPSFLVGTQVGFEKVSELQTIKKTSLTWDLFPDYYSTSGKFIWIGIGAVAVFNKRLAAVGGFTNHWINAEDSDLWMRLGTAKDFVQIKSPPLFGYRHHASSAMSEFERTYEGKCFIARQEKYNRYPGGTSRRKERLTMVTRHVRSTSVDCLRHGNILDGWKLYLISFRWNLFLGRLRYLFGFPIITFCTFFRNLKWRTNTLRVSSKSYQID